MTRDKNYPSSWLTPYDPSANLGISSTKLVGGWALPLWKMWIRQLGLFFPIYGKVIQMFQTTNQQSKGWRMMLTKTTIHSRAESF